MYLSELCVQARLVSLFAETLRARGLDAEALLAEVGLHAEALRTPDARVPASAFNRLWNLAFEATGDATIALEHARRFQPATFHVLGFVLFGGATLHEATELTVRHLRVILEEPRVTYAADGEEFSVSVQAENAPIRALSMVANVLCLWRIVSRPDLRPLFVTVAGVTEPASEQANAIRAHFDCPVRFDADVTRIAIDKAEALRRLPGADPDLARRGEAVVKSYLADLDHLGPAPAVTAQVVEQLNAGRFDKDQVARQLGMSASTLQRRLAAEGVTFRRVVDDTRRDLAEHYVREGRRPIKEIAYLLGFSDLSNFTRAFRAWFGVPPKAYQAQVRSESEAGAL